MLKLHTLALVAIVALLSAPTAHAQNEFTSDFGREGCTFSSVGANPYLPLTPGLGLRLVGDSEDDGEIVEVEVQITVLGDTRMVDGVTTRVVEEREFEDGELIEVSRNFMASCRETGAVWYFGEEVDIYEDGEVVSHDGAWFAGVDGAKPGILMPGTPLIGARYYQELAPGIAEDRGEIVGFEDEAFVEAGTFEDVLVVVDTNALSPEDADEKLYARGVGLIKDEDIELVEITPASCTPDEHTLCLGSGRFRVDVAWSLPALPEQNAHAVQKADASGEFWFFDAGNVELTVKVLDACGLGGFNNYWVFSSGLTDLDVTLTVTDTKTGAERVYENDGSGPFGPILDTAAFQTCP
ncbi:MAG: hypothetical protein HYU52_04120 [Acidobacteria bacterium]|nr:hypothetical protein [Acidobacteriota bacterium]